MDCSGGEGTGQPVGFAQLDFSQATVAYSNIGGLGPDTSAARALRLDNVGTNLDGSRLDLLVTNRSRYRVNNAPLNGIEGAFGRINVYIGTSVDLTMTFVAGGTDEPVTLDYVMLTFYDFDQGLQNTEVITMKSFQTYTLTSDTEIIPAGDVYSSTFTASVYGDGDDNPSDPKALTSAQARRSVAFTFSTVSSIELTFDSQGLGNGGRNFLFAGESFLLPGCPMPPAPPSPPPPPPPGLPAPPPGPPCRNTFEADAGTFNFATATLRHSNLGGLGPDTASPANLHFGRVGTLADGTQYDLVVTALSGYNFNNNELNGLTKNDTSNTNTGFGRINLLGPKPSTGLGLTYVDLEYCFVDSTTAEPVTPVLITFTLFDFDQPKPNNGRECLKIAGFEDYTLADNTEIVVTTSAQESGPTTFCGTQVGTGDDNPTDPDDLTPLQLSRSIAFTFSKKSCFYLTYSVSCCMNTGRNFLWAGESAVRPLCKSPPPLMPFYPAPPPAPPSPPPGASPPPPTPIIPIDAKPCRFDGENANLGRVGFADAVLRHTNLAGIGPDFSEPQSMRLDNVGFSRSGQPLSLDIVVLNNHINKYEAHNSMNNVLSSAKFGNINLKAPHENDGVDATYVDLSFCLLNQQTDEPHEMGSFQVCACTCHAQCRARAMHSAMHSAVCVPYTCPGRVHLVHAHPHFPDDLLRLRRGLGR